MDDRAAARRYREEALSILTSLGAELSFAHTLGSMGHDARNRGDFAEAHALYCESLRRRLQLRDDFVTAVSLEDFAALARLQGEYARASTLLGAALAFREANGKPFLPLDQTNYARTTGEARGALGDESFEAAWQTGRAMSLTQATTFALSTPGMDPEA